jgi:hypothetical protein
MTIIESMERARLHDIPEGFRFDFAQDGIVQPFETKCPTCGDTDTDTHRFTISYNQECFLSRDDPIVASSKRYSITYWDCCYVICENNVSWNRYGMLHAVERDSGVCDHCERCVDDHCDCLHCGRCAIACDSVCGNCERCEDCCGCYYCSSCNEMMDCDDFCGECDHCTNCCGCRDNCDCEAARQRFTFRNGDGAVANDERFTAELPAGLIDESGLGLVCDYVTRAIYDAQDPPAAEGKYPEGFRHWGDVNTLVRSAIDEIGPLWQAKRGNFTKRLSSALHKRQIKLAPEMIAQVGNICRSHTSDNASWDVEFTRNLNLPAEDFYHEDSCWWQSYSESRCALKSWGGLGMRTFDSDGTVSGRAWVQPLNEYNELTSDVATAKAFVVYNGYGELSGYTAARIIADMTGLTYKRIRFSAGVQYINSDGYLVGDQIACNATDEITIRRDAHERV